MDEPMLVAEGVLRMMLRDGQPVLQLRCPACGCWGDIDDDQLHGRVSVDHTDCVRGGWLPRPQLHPCTFHETRDWYSTAIRLSTDASRAHGWPWDWESEGRGDPSVQDET